MLVRRADPPLRAVQVSVPTNLQFSTGAPWRANPGDWVITLGENLVDVVNPALFHERYAPIVEGLLLPRSLCVQLEEIVGVGATRNPDELLKATRHLAEICIGAVRIPFTPGQLAELKHRAEKRGQTVEQAIQAVIDRIKDEIFYRS